MNLVLPRPSIVLDRTTLRIHFLFSSCCFLDFLLCCLFYCPNHSLLVLQISIDCFVRCRIVSNCNHLALGLYHSCLLGLSRLLGLQLCSLPLLFFDSSQLLLVYSLLLSQKLHPKIITHWSSGEAHAVVITAGCHVRPDGPAKNNAA